MRSFTAKAYRFSAKADRILEMDKNKLSRQPFLGHEGISARIEFIQTPQANSLSGPCIWVLRETSRSQLLQLFTIGVVGFFPLWVLIMESAKINGGTFGVCILAIAPMVGIPFFIKSAHRFLGRRRIEIDPSRQTMTFFTAGQDAVRTVSFSEIRDVVMDMQTTHGLQARMEKHIRSCAFLILQLQDDSQIKLAASDKTVSIQQAREDLLRILPINP